MENQVEQLLRCAVGLYGILHVRHLKEVVEHYGDHSCTRKEIMGYLEKNPLKGCCYKDGFLYQEGVFDRWEQWEYILERSAKKPLYFPEKEEFLRYEDANYIEWNASAQQLLVFLQTQSGFGNLRPLIERIALDLRHGQSLQEEMKKIINMHIYIPEEQLSQFGTLFLAFYHAVHLFVNHGFTPQELMDARHK